MAVGFRYENYGTFTGPAGVYDYDDSDWEMAVSYGMNYQNNSYQIFST